MGAKLSLVPSLSLYSVLGGKWRASHREKRKVLAGIHCLRIFWTGDEAIGKAVL